MSTIDYFGVLAAIYLAQATSKTTALVFGVLFTAVQVMLVVVKQIGVAQ